MKWKKQEIDCGFSSLPVTLSHALPRASSMFPNISVLLILLCTLLVTSCSSERSFSGLKRIKTALRSTMSNERLSSLALLHLYRDIEGFARPPSYETLEYIFRLIATYNYKRPAYYAHAPEKHALAKVGFLACFHAIYLERSRFRKNAQF